MPAPRTSPRPIRPPRRAVAPVAGLLVAALLLAGCGGASHQPKVASLAPPGGGSHPTATAGAIANRGIPDPDGRPRESIDNTMAQNDAMDKAFNHCAPYHQDRSYKTWLVEAQKCVRFLPLPPWQFDPANPQARAYIGATVSCLQARGYHVKAYLYPPPKPLSAIWDVVDPSGNLFGQGGSPHAAQLAFIACKQRALK